MSNDWTLEPTAMYALAAPTVPDAAREEAMALVEGGRALDVKGVQDLVAKHKEQTRARARAARVEEDAAVGPEIQLPPSIIVRQADALRLPLPDGTADLVVTSPPYGVGKAYKGYSDEATAWPAYMQDALVEARRVTGERGRLALNVPLDTTRGGYRPTYAQAVDVALAAGWRYRFSIVWLEPNISKTVARGSADSPLAPHVIAPCEMVAVFSNGEWGQIAQPGLETDISHDEWLAWTSGVWDIPGESNPWEDFPAAMPEELAERLIRLLTFVGDTVCDPFGGSGTTAVVAAMLRRDVAVFDIDEGQVASIKRRVQRAVADGAIKLGLGDAS